MPFRLPILVARILSGDLLPISFSVILIGLLGASLHPEGLGFDWQHWVTVSTRKGSTEQSDRWPVGEWSYPVPMAPLQFKCYLHSCRYEQSPTPLTKHWCLRVRAKYAGRSGTATPWLSCDGGQWPLPILWLAILEMSGFCWIQECIKCMAKVNLHF